MFTAATEKPALVSERNGTPILQSSSPPSRESMGQYRKGSGDRGSYILEGVRGWLLLQNPWCHFAGVLKRLADELMGADVDLWRV